MSQSDYTVRYWWDEQGIAKAVRTQRIDARSLMEGGTCLLLDMAQRIGRQIDACEVYLSHAPAQNDREMSLVWRRDSPHEHIEITTGEVYAAE